MAAAAATQCTPTAATVAEQLLATAAAATSPWQCLEATAIGLSTTATVASEPQSGQRQRQRQQQRDEPISICHQS